MSETTENTPVAAEETSAASEMIIEVIEPQKEFVDETISVELGEFQKIVEETTVNQEGVHITTKKVVEMSEDEIISTKIRSLKIKVALGTATTAEKSDLKLLIG